MEDLNTFAPFVECLPLIKDRALFAFASIVYEDERELIEHIKKQLTSEDLKDFFDGKDRHTSPFEILWTASEGLSFGGAELSFKIGINWHCLKTYELNKRVWLTVLQYSPFFPNMT